MRFRLRARNEAMEDSVVILAVALSSGHFYHPHFIRTFGESEPNSHESVALSREYCSSPPEILFLRYSSSALSGKAFHVILEQPVHDNFECIDNQVISKKGAHFGSLKLSKCAL